MSTQMHDVIVIGGGPAGSCAANLLARAGVDVVVLEREYFPRFHIGESLLPMELSILARLEVDLDDGRFLRKNGAKFIDERDGRSSRFSFDEGLPGTPSHAHQVERSIFDLELLRAAGRAGAQIREGHEVLSVSLGEDQVEALVRPRANPDSPDPSGPKASFKLTARYLVDASGQTALLARVGKTVEPYREFGRAAVFRHFRKVAPEVIREMHESGDIIIKIVDDGWMWVIPLVSGDLSIGVVKTKGKMEAATLDLEVERSPLLTRLTAGTEISPATTIGNYSYRNTRSYGRRYACIGDAACFLDPVFSSGVAMALAGGERLADLLAPALAESREHEATLMAPLAAHMDRAYETMSRFIHRFYHTRLIDNVLFTENTEGELRSGVISVLAADVWRDDNPFQNMLLRARRSS